MALLSKRTSDFFPSVFDDDFFAGDLINWMRSGFPIQNKTLPAVNVKESDNEYMIEVAAPGMAKDDFKVNIENNRLTISSEKKYESEEKNKKENYTRREFSYQSFQRSFTIPEDEVDANKVNASYKDGILHISLPKKAEVKTKLSKEIKIN